MKDSISDLIMKYFKKHPNKDLKHGPVVDWVEEQYLTLYGKKPRDPWRAIRKLHEEGKLIKVRKGVHRYDPNHVHKVELYDFSPKVKEQIFERDDYRCILCGLGRDDGVEICADHKKPKDKGGANTVENGQTLCTKHNLLKKNYSQTEAGKRFFVKLFEDAISYGDEKMIDFCKQVFDTYDEHDVDSHISRPDRRGQKRLFS